MIVRKYYISIDPETGDGKEEYQKQYEPKHINELLADRQNILFNETEIFGNFDSETLRLIEEGNYMLFMDDIYTMGPYLPVSECNREMLLETARVSVHQRRKLVPGKGLDSLDVFQDVVNGIKDSLLYQAKDGEWLWSMPKEVLEKF